MSDPRLTITPAVSAELFERVDAGEGDGFSEFHRAADLRRIGRRLAAFERAFRLLVYDAGPSNGVRLRPDTVDGFNRIVGVAMLAAEAALECPYSTSTVTTCDECKGGGETVGGTCAKCGGRGITFTPRERGRDNGVV